MKYGVLLILVVMAVSCVTPSYMHLYESRKVWISRRVNGW